MESTCSASLSAMIADDADQPLEVERLVDRRDERLGARGVVRGVDEHGRVERTTWSRPGEVASPNAASTIAPSRARSPAEQAPRPPRGRGRRCAPGARRRAAGRSPCRARTACCSVDELPADGELPPGDGEVLALAQHSGALGGRGLDDDRLGDVALLAPSTTAAPSLMIPAFSVAISAIVSPSQRSWSMAIGVKTATSPSATLVESHAPPMPTSSTATSTGASAKAANASTVSTSKNVSRGPPASSDSPSTTSTYGAMSSQISTKRASVIGSPSITMRSVTASGAGS